MAGESEERRLRYKTMKWLAGLLLFGLCLLTTTGSVLADDTNLLVNPGFEDTEGALPNDWSLDAWNPATEATRASVQSGLAHGGKSYAVLENLQPNDAKWVQTVEVKAKTTYRLSAWIKISGIDNDGKGANVSVLGVIETSKELVNTNGDWQKVELYGKTGAGQTQLQIAVRLGGYGSLTIGKAFFDDVELTKVSSVPAGVKAISFAPRTAPPPPAGDPSDVSPLPIMGQAVLYAILFGIIYIWGLRRSDNEPLPTRALGLWTAVILMAALALRLLAALKSDGYPADISTFMAWATHAAKDGLPRFYDGSIFADYPPGYIYVLWLVGKLASAFGIAPGSDGMRLLVRLPAIAADLAICALFIRLGAKRGNVKVGLMLALLYGLNPGVWVDSASWGQVDSVLTLALLAALLQLVGGRTNRAAVLFAVTVLIKPQALIFAPVFLFPTILRRAWRELAIGLLCAIGAFLLLIVPFSLHQPFGWIAKLYQSTLSSYPYATLNAFNLFALTGANWKASAAKTLLLSYDDWGMIFIYVSVALSAALFFRKREYDSGKIMYTALLLIVGVFVLGAKMHERYLYPAIALSALAYLFSKDRRLLFISLGLSLTQYINVAFVLAFGVRNQSAIPPLDGVLLMTSAANVLLLAFLIRVGYDLWVNGRVLPILPFGAAEEEDEGPMPNTETAAPHEETAASSGAPAAAAAPDRSPGASGRLFSRRDWLLLGALMLVYSVLALYHLGSFKAPQTYWQPEKAEQEVVIDFGAPYQISRLNSFAGVGEGKYKLSFSTDRQQWVNEMELDLNYTKDFVWNTTDLNLTARYVKLSVVTPGGMLNELAFYGQGNGKLLPVVNVQGDNVGSDDSSDPRRLVDEPDQTVYKPSYLYGTYFDEIYHARTAFEHLHGIKPYETTHPPLGKLLIGVGIAVFGMNPFGWRIVGTLFGIAMIPIMYAFGKRLFGRTEWAFASAFLFTFDFMHFAQTRIATIDVYGVFFILLMFYYMYKYMALNFYDEPLGRTLRPLFWSGLWFGVGAASKWIVLYGGAGLAFLFFYSLYERYREFEVAKRFMEKGAKGKAARDPAILETYRRRIELFANRTWKTMVFCLLAFVLIPAVVYSASFLPALTSKGETLSFQRLIDYQTSMYDYHTKLKATHAFSSTWYEWPIMKKPIWYYSGTNVDPGKTSSIVSMGNPAVWWFGIAAFPIAFILAWRRKHKGMLVVLAAYISQYVPWMLVARLTFIYHYFAMVPFLVLCIVYVLKTWKETNPAAKKWIYGYLALTFVLFAMFFPVLSGLEVSKAYVDNVLRWFPGWYF